MHKKGFSSLVKKSDRTSLSTTKRFNLVLSCKVDYSTKILHMSATSLKLILFHNSQIR